MTSRHVFYLLERIFFIIDKKRRHRYGPRRFLSLISYTYRAGGQLPIVMRRTAFLSFDFRISALFSIMARWRNRELKGRIWDDK